MMFKRDVLLFQMNGFTIQLYATIVLSISCFLSGFSIGWATYIVSMLQKEESPLKAADHKMSLPDIARITVSFIPIFFSVYLNEKVSRKYLKIAYGLCFVLSWTLITLAAVETEIIIGQMISAIVMGMDFITTYAYISEIVEDHRRGMLLSIPLLQATMGAFVSVLLGAYSSYETINYLNVSLSIAYLLLLTSLKETPAFLLGQGKNEEAVNSLKFYRGKEAVTKKISEELNTLKLDLLREENSTIDDDVKIFEVEFLSVLKVAENLNSWEVFGIIGYADDSTIVERYVSNARANHHEIQAMRESMIGRVDLALQRVSNWGENVSLPIRRAAYAVTFQIFIISFMGTFAVQSYVAHFFADVFPEMSFVSCVLALYSALMIGSALGVVLIDLLPRRTLMISSSIFCTMALFLLASQFRWRWTEAWTVPCASLAFCCVYQAGVSNVAAVQMAEMFPSDVKVIVVMVSLSIIMSAHFVTVYTCKSIVDQVGVDIGFFFFAVMGIINTIWSHYFTKETRNVPVRQIMEMYSVGYLYKNDHRILPLQMNK